MVAESMENTVDIKSVVTQVKYTNVETIFSILCNDDILNNENSFVEPNKRKIGFGWSFVLSIFLSPLIGLSLSSEFTKV